MRAPRYSALVPSKRFLILNEKIDCHPERRLARIVRQTESKDLRLPFGIYVMNFWNTTPESQRDRITAPSSPDGSAPATPLNPQSRLNCAKS
jgi:hypothetical protein